MTKTYAEICLERAKRAIEGPYDIERVAFDGGDFAYEINDGQQLVQFYEHNFKSPMKAKFAAELYAHARTDVPELARRLQKACEELRLSCITLRRCGQHGEAILNEQIADKLERVPENADRF